MKIRKPHGNFQPTPRPGADGPTGQAAQPKPRPRGAQGPKHTAANQAAAGVEHVGKKPRKDAAQDGTGPRAGAKGADAILEAPEGMFTGPETPMEGISVGDEAEQVGEGGQKFKAADGGDEDGIGSASTGAGKRVGGGGDKLDLETLLELIRSSGIDLQEILSALSGKQGAERG